MQQTSYRRKLTKYDLPPTPHFARDDYLIGDFDEGTLVTAFGTRVIVLPEELVQGLHEALEFETGRAWSIVCYTCGRNWGARLMQMMQNEWREHYRQQLEHMDFEMFERWMSDYFTFNGWGQLEIDFTQEHRGVVLFHLRDSVLDAILADFPHDYVNEIFAGMVAAMSTWLAGRELDCLEVAQASEEGGALLAVTLPERVTHARRLRASGASTEEMLDALGASPGA
jgi:hypothetical protein